MLWICLVLIVRLTIPATAQQKPVGVAGDAPGAYSSPQQFHKHGRAVVPEIKARVKHSVPAVHPGGDASRIAGRVVFFCVISKSGNVEELKLVSGHPILAEEAIEAARQYTFFPYHVNGKVVEFETTITIHFYAKNKRY